MSVCIICMYVCVCVSSLQARVENDILGYKDLAALPKVKAIYEVQQPDLRSSSSSSSYQPYHRYTSADRLDSYSYREVLLPHTVPGQTLRTNPNSPNRSDQFTNPPLGGSRWLYNQKEKSISRCRS